MCNVASVSVTVCAQWVTRTHNVIHAHAYASTQIIALHDTYALRLDLKLPCSDRAEVRRSFITKTVLEESQVTPQGP